VTAALRLTVIAYALGITVVCVLSAARGRVRSPLVNAALAMLQVGLIVQALLDIVDIARGHHGRGIGVHLGYLVTSVVLIPLAAGGLRPDRGRWGSVSLAAGCLVLAVVCVRLDQTLPSA
jgi:hypothetical protein